MCKLETLSILLALKKRKKKEDREREKFNETYGFADRTTRWCGSDD